MTISSVAHVAVQPYNLNMNVLNSEKDILTFLKFYRKNFLNASILPKMHIMEDHTVPWLRRWRIGSGLMGEQGAESVHAHMNSLDRTHRHIPDEVARLKYIFKVLVYICLMNYS